MAHVTCILPNTLNLVIRPERWIKTVNENKDILPADIEDFRQELNRISKNGIPVTLELSKEGKTRLFFCTRHYEIACGLNDRNNAYNFHFITRLIYHRYSKVARQSVKVIIKADPAWQIHESLYSLPEDGENTYTGFNEIKSSWDELISRKPSIVSSDQNKITLENQKFIGDIENLIDLSYKAQESQPGLQSIPVKSPQSVAKERLLGDIYQFNVESHDFKLGDYIWVGRGDPSESYIGYAGVIVESAKHSLVIKFHRQVDLKLINDVEWLKPLQSFRQYEIQKTAVRALKDGKSNNPYLLDVIVRGNFVPQSDYKAEIHSLGDLNESQLQAVKFTDEVYDLLLVVGPPGTGKTKTIREIVKRFASRGQRVLITSKSNKAVDNVLEGLEDVSAIRIGREEAISSRVQPLMIDAQARELQSKIRQNTLPILLKLKNTLDLWPQIKPHLEKIAKDAKELANLTEQYALAKSNLSKWIIERTRYYQEVVDRHEKKRQTKVEEIKKINNQIKSATTKIAKLNDRSKWLIIGGLFAGSLVNVQKEKQGLERLLQRTRQDLEEASKEKTRVENIRDKELLESEEVFQLKEKVEKAQKARTLFRSHTLQTLRELWKIFPHLNNAPTFPRVITSESLSSFAETLQDYYQNTKARCNLLSDWHILLQERHQSLYPTLIRMVDVVGATCIGVATDARFEDLDFDLVIADEAGQIQVMDLLVPLIRANKAVLVGDHHQLPPVVEDELKKLVDPENDELVTWLNKSLFEILIERESVPDNRRVMLDTQYRIPKIVADFISEKFYSGKYNTGKIKRYRDPFFTEPMIFINTQRISDRREREIFEINGSVSIINKLESQIIINLALAYQEKGREWGVIVPYKKQAERIRQGLKDYIQMDILNDWVSTVDAFQGKERDVIIYGFTRSNDAGRVGFLAELRRLNVSLTRARGQLIMIGDAGFLTRTNNKDFSLFMKSLLSIIKDDSGALIYAGQLKEYLSS